MEQQDLIGCHDQVHFDIRGLDCSPYISFFISFANSLLMLFGAWKNCASLIAAPNIDIVIESGVELANHFLGIRTRFLSQHFLNEFGYLLHYLLNC